MKTVSSQWRDAGYYTVPLQGTLERLQDGKKSIPIFPRDWKNVYSTTLNTEDTPLCGLITGAINNIIILDCDNQDTLDMLLAMDTDAFCIKSVGKAKGGGTIFYTYNSEIATNSIKNNFIELDVFSDGGFIYLPCENNNTKEKWQCEEIPTFKPLPSCIYTYLMSVFAKKNDTSNTEISKVHNFRLYPLIKDFVDNNCEYSPKLFRIITPKKFRTLDAYTSQGHLHPNDIPVGTGSVYLSQISCILGSDISISSELYFQVMYGINALWTTPMDKDILDTTILNRMVEGSTVIDGKVVWKYDKYWKRLGFVFSASTGDSMESFFDDRKGLYYVINYTDGYVKTYTEISKCVNTIESMTGQKLTKVGFNSSKQIIRTSLSPHLDFGHIGEKEFNLFRQTPKLHILTNPELYAQKYTYPSTIMEYFNSLIPKREIREYVLSFMKTKLLTFNYSPIILYLMGAHGSGKDTFVRIWEEILGSNYIAKPDLRVYLENFNGWIMDKYIVHLDEFGTKTQNYHVRMDVLGKSKSYSGSSNLQIRAMRQDGFNYSHSMTIVMTDNVNPLQVESGDRRFVIINTPNMLKDEEWVIKSGGIKQVYDKIIEEIDDFCYYLATQVPFLSDDEYVNAPYTKDKVRLIIDGMNASQKIAYLIKNGEYEQLEELAYEYGVLEFTKGWKNDRLYVTKIETLYFEITENKGTKEAIKKALYSLGLRREHTTLQGKNVFFYRIPNLHLYKIKFGVEFETFSGEVELE